MQIQLSTNQRSWGKGYSTNADGAALAAAPTATDPLGTGVVNATRYNLAKVCFFGTDAADETATAYVYQWTHAGGDLWVPNTQAKVTLALGTATGVAGKTVTNTERFADTISFVDGDESVKISSIESNDVATLLFDLEGCSRWQISFDLGTMASANFLYAMF